MQRYSAVSRYPKLNEMKPDTLIDIKDVPQYKQGIRQSSFSQQVFAPVLNRLHWLAVGVLSIGSIPFLFLRLLIYFVLVLFGAVSLKKLQQAFVSLFIFPLSGVFLALLGLLPFSQFAKKWVVNQILPASEVYADYLKKLPINPVSDELLRNADYYQIAIQNQLCIDSIDFPRRFKTPYTRIHFCGNASFYEVSYRRIIEEDKVLKCNGRAFNYPGIKNRTELKSITDLVNAGIAQVFHVAQLNNWSNPEVERYVHLYGRSLGGVIALQVALYFKQQFNLDLLVVVDRSLSSISNVAAARINRKIGLPTSYAKWMCTQILAAAGGFDANSVTAVKKLEPTKIYYFNVAAPSKIDQTLWSKITTQLGITPEFDPDRDIPTGSSLAEGLIKARGSKGLGYFLYTQNYNDSHYAELSTLSVSPYEFKDALQYYASILPNSTA